MTNTHYEEAYAVLAEQFRSCFRSFLRDVGKLDGGRRLIKQSGIQQRFEAAELFRIKNLARNLFAYMQYRMELEQEYMPPGSYPDEADSFHFYSELLLAGGREIFGVEVGEHALIGDLENAAALHAWTVKTANQAQITSIDEAGAATGGIRPASVPKRANTPVITLRTVKDTPPVRLVREGSDARNEPGDAPSAPATAPS